MKNFSTFALLFAFCFCISCKNEEDVDISMLRDEGLGLYWDHQVSLTGRQYLMDFSSLKQIRDEYDFEFDYKITGHDVTVRLVKTIHKGKCQSYPGPWGDLCTSNGTIYIPEEELPIGSYNFKFVTGKFSVTSRLIVEKDSVTLDVPPNSHLSNHTPTIYPLPKGLLYGGIVYSGGQNEKFVRNLIEDLETLDLKPVNLPDYKYNHLDMQRNKHLQVESWEPDNHAISVLYRSNADIKTVFEITRKHFELSGKKLTMGLFSSSKANEIHISPDEEPRLFNGD